MPGEPEAFSRVLIDQALKDSNWNLLDPQQVRFELHSATGRADYVLGGIRGPLCVVEAKREDLDPYDSKDQARGYAENLRAPFVILSNGREHWFWNHERADQRDAYRIERLPSAIPLHYFPTGTAPFTMLRASWATMGRGDAILLGLSPCQGARVVFGRSKKRPRGRS